MLQHYTKITLLLLILIIGGCSSKKPDDITPKEAVTLLPQTLTIESFYEKTPTNLAFVWQDTIITSYTITSINANKHTDFVRTYDFTRNSQNLIQTKKYTYQGADYPDGSSTYEYHYNEDGTEMSLPDHQTWLYNSNGQLIKYYSGNPNNAFYSYDYDNSGQLTRFRNKDGSRDITYSMSSFTSVVNPLYLLAEKTQFLALGYPNEIVTLFCSKMIPRSFIFSGIPNYVDYSLDEHKRVNAITVTYNGNVLNKFTFGY